MDGRVIIPDASRTPVFRVARRRPLRIRLPDPISSANPAPRGWFALSRLSMAASVVFHTAAVAALLQVPGVADRATRAAGEILHVVYLGRMEAPRAPPPPPPPPAPDPTPEPIVMAVVEPMPPPPVAMDPIPVAVTNTPPVEVVPEPEPPPSAPAMVAVHEEPAAPSVEVAAPAPPVADPATAIDSGPAWDAIRTAIHRHLAYPDSARRRGEEGRVLLALTVGADGALVEAEALAEGASSRLMTAALTAVRRAAPFAPSARGEFNIPVVFRLTPARGTGI